MLLEAVDCGDVTVRAAERRVKAGLARLETERRAEQLAVVGTETPTDVPACAGEVILEAPGVKLVQVDALTLLRSLPDGCIETVFFDGDSNPIAAVRETSMVTRGYVGSC